MRKLFIFVVLFYSNLTLAEDFLVPITTKISSNILTKTSFKTKQLTLEEQLELYLKDEINFLNCSLDQFNLIKNKIPVEKICKPLIAINWCNETYIVSRKEIKNFNNIKINKKYKAICRPNREEILFLEKIFKLNDIKNYEIIFDNDIYDNFKKDLSLDFAVVSSDDIFNITGGNPIADGTETTIDCNILISSINNHTVLNCLFVNEKFYLDNQEDINKILEKYFINLDKLKFDEYFYNYKGSLRKIELYKIFDNLDFIKLYDQNQILKNHNPINLDSLIGRFNKILFEKNSKNLKYKKLEDSRFIFSIKINIKPNQTEFEIKDYKKEFEKIKEFSILFPNSLIVITGHADNHKIINSFLQIALKDNLIYKKNLNYYYCKDNSLFDLDKIDNLIFTINNYTYPKSLAENPAKILASANNLALYRAKKVKELFISQFALQEERILLQNKGIEDPIYLNPKNIEESYQNMRVEFRFFE